MVTLPKTTGTNLWLWMIFVPSWKPVRGVSPVSCSRVIWRKVNSPYLVLFPRVSITDACVDFQVSGTKARAELFRETKDPDTSIYLTNSQTSLTMLDKLNASTLKRREVLKTKTAAA
jgi:hypothetical protein